MVSYPFCQVLFIYLFILFGHSRERTVPKDFSLVHDLSNDPNIFCCFCLQEKVAKAQEVKDVAMSSLVQATEDEKKEQWRVEGRAMLFDAKRVSITILSFLFLYSSILT